MAKVLFWVWGFTGLGFTGPGCKGLRCLGGSSRSPHCSTELSRVDGTFKTWWFGEEADCPFPGFEAP